MDNVSTLKGLLLVLFVCFVRTALGVAVGTGKFDCRRPGQDICANNAKCTSEGKCDCPAGYEGYKCNIQTSTIDGTKCKPACGAKGTCADDSGTFKCFCDADYLDEGICDKPRYKVQCDTKDMFVNLDPIGSFQGRIYVSGKESTCVLQEVGKVTGLPKEFISGLGRVIPHTDTACGDAVDKSTKETVQKSRNIYVQYSADYSSSIDEVVEALCSYESGQTVTFNSVFKSVLPATIEGSSQEGAIRVSAIGDLNPLRLKIFKDGTEVTSTTKIRIGTALTMELSIFPEKEFEDFVVETLTIDNNKEVANLRSTEVITKRCHVGGDVTGIIPPGERKPGNLKTVFTFMTIKYSNSDDVRIVFKAKLCKKGDTAGCVIKCDARRKRAAATGDARTIQVVMKISDYEEGSSQGAKKPEGSRSTSMLGMSEGILAGVIALSVVILVVIVLVTVFMWRALRRKDTEKYRNVS